MLYTYYDVLSSPTVTHSVVYTTFVALSVSSLEERSMFMPVIQNPVLFQFPSLYYEFVVTFHRNVHTQDVELQ